MLDKRRKPLVIRWAVSFPVFEEKKSVKRKIAGASRQFKHSR
jgi:hypothetical protein